MVSIMEYKYTFIKHQISFENHMATASNQLTVEMLKTSKNKDKACIDGFLYTLSQRSQTAGPRAESGPQAHFFGPRSLDGFGAIYI